MSELSTIVKHYYIITASDEKGSCKNLFHVGMKSEKNYVGLMESWSTFVVIFRVELSNQIYSIMGLCFVKDRFQGYLIYVGTRKSNT